MTRSILVHAAAIGLAGALGAGTVQAADRIIVFAPDYTQADAEAFGSVLSTIFASQTAGDRLTGIMGSSGRTIFDVRIPDEQLYAGHRKHREKLLNPAWNQQVMPFLRDAVEKGQSATGSAPASQADLPATFQDVAYTTERRPEVMVFGNPIFYDARMPDFSFEKGYPTDGHLALSRAQSPFGAKDMEGLLDGIENIHFCLTAETEWVNTAHEEGTHRFYSLHAEALGTRLATFTQDLAGCARRFMEADAAGARKFERDMHDDRFSMVDVTGYSELPTTLQAEIGAGITRMRTLFLYDTDQEDGDVVDIVATGGYSRRIALKKVPQMVEVPVTHGALHVVGVRDGNGGITVGVRTTAGQVIVSDNIAVGQKIEIPLGIF